MKRSVYTRVMMMAALAFLATSLAASSYAEAFFVAPDGDDANPGTETRPFQTLERAREAVRAALPEAREDIVVTMAGGTYTLEAPLVLTAADSGREGVAVIYAAAAGETPVISGAIRAANWEQDADGRWKTTLDVADMRHLFVNGVRATRARGECPEGVERFGDLAFIDEEGGYFFPDAAMASWRNPGGIELGEYSSWAHMTCKVDRIGAVEDGRAKVYMAQPWFFLASKKEGRAFGTPGYIENAFELLDEPGEFYFDKPERTLYYLPREGEDMASAEAAVPVLETLLRIEGALDAPVRNVMFRGITFAEATWLRPNRIGHGDVQANFVIGDTNLYERDGSLINVQNEYIKSPAHIVLHAAVDCRFEACAFTRLGGAALDIECGAQGNTVDGCAFHDISGSAIQVGDVLAEDHHPRDPRSIVSDNTITNNEIHDIGVEYKDSVGVFAGYTDGTVIAHNEIHDLPYSGISVGWGWGEPDSGGGGYPTPYAFEQPTPSGNNRIEYNHIYGVMLEQDDGGGIYTLSNQPGTIIRGNHVHDNGPGGPGGIYLDEGSGFIEITGNVVYNVNNPMNYNNHVQDRIDTCNEHGNTFGIAPDGKDFPKDVAAAAGIQKKP